MKMTLNQALEAAISSCKIGDFEIAAQYYKAILKKLPHHPEANHNLAQISLNSSPSNEVIELFERAVNVETEVILYWKSYINYLLTIEKFNEAQHVLTNIKKNNFPKDEVDKLENHFKSMKNTSYKNQTIQKIIDLIEGKKFDQALLLAQELNALSPSNKIVLNLLGIIQTHKKDYESASGYFNAAIKVDALYAPAHTNYGNLLRDQNKIEESTKQYLIACEIDPQDYENKINFGKLQLTKKDFDAAINLFQNAIMLKPEDNRAYFYLGTALMETGQYDAAVKELDRAHSLNPSDIHVLNNLAICQRQQGKLEQAIDTLKTSLSVNNQSVVTQLKIAALYEEVKDLRSAFVFYSSILKTDKDNVDALIGLGRLSIPTDPNIAVGYLNHALSLKPNDVPLLNLIAKANIERFEFDLAENCFQKALLLDENHIETLVNTIYFYQYIKKFRKASFLIKRVLELNPNNIPANILSLKMGTEDMRTKAHTKLLHLSKNKSNTIPEKYSIYFSLAEQADHFKSYKKAFALYTKANKLKLGEINYSWDDEIIESNNIKSIFKLLNKIKVDFPSNKDVFTPVFIIGMPRSGTSLVEQIVSAHSEVFGAGELTLFSRFSKQLNLENLSKETISKFREKYTAKALSVRNSERFVTDKLPANFKHLGLIMKVFPEAKIIHVKRDPSATCWSNYTQLFSNGQGYSYDLHSIRKYFKIYSDYMKFWESQFDKKIYNLEYEKLVNNFENEVRDLVNFCGLPWDSKCLHPHKNTKPVTTASKLQVRKKVYTGSSEKWKNYKPFIGDIFEGL
jgi:tetratricopeptide (TPR) repeat protein